MLKLLNLILLLLICIPQLSFSAEKLFPGYYINKNGDSIRCDFENKDGHQTPQKIVVVISGQRITLEPKDIRRFEITGFGNYISANVTYHTETVSGTDLADEFSDKTETKDCFLRVIIENYYSLYEIVLPHRVCFFTSENNSDPIELIYRTRRKQMELEEDKRYRNTIFELFVKENLQHTYINRINDAKYKSKDLSSLVEVLNTNHPIITKRSNKKRSGLQIEVFAGMINNSFSNTFSSLYSEHNKLENSLSPSVGLNFQYVIPHRFESFAVGASFGFNRYNSSATVSGVNLDSSSRYYYTKTTYNEQFQFQNTLLLIDMYGQYTINPLNRVKFYVKGGLNCNISLTKNKGINDTYSATTFAIAGLTPRNTSEEGSKIIMQTRGMYYNFRGDIGLAANRHKLELSWFSPAKLNPNASFKINMIGAHYYFLILK